jgi:sec-independent protein translocase protein TatA
MGTFSIWHWLIVLVVVLILFGGRGKISQLMGDFGKGLKNFRKSMKEDEPFEEPPVASEPPKAIASEPPRVSEPSRDRDRAASS